MKRRGSKVVLLGLAALLLFVSADWWGRYMGQGIANGSIVGLPGREQDLASFGSQAMKALKIAVFSEASAIAIVAWVFTARKGVWIKLCMALGLAAATDIFTFAVVRGL